MTDEETCVLLLIPSVHDATLTLAPEGHAVLHIYTPATERFDRWEGLERNTHEFDARKEEWS